LSYSLIKSGLSIGTKIGNVQWPWTSLLHLSNWMELRRTAYRWTDKASGTNV